MKVTVTVRLSVKVTVHACPDAISHPAHPTNVELPVGVAVSVTVVPVAKLVEHVAAHPSPAGELAMVPVPVPAKSTVSVGPVPVKQVTFAVIFPVTTAPGEDNPASVLFLVTVAEIRALPQDCPVAVITPVELTVTICGVFETQVTWSVMSLVAGGWM